MRKAWIIVLVATLGLVGCGGDDGDETAVEDIPAPGAQTTQPGVVAHDHGPGAAPQGCPEPSANISIVASNTRFNTDCLSAVANQPITLSFENRDQIGHNIVFLESHTATDVMFRADIFTGPRTQTFTVTPQRPGTYAFHCEVHPTTMMGTFVVK